MKKSRYTEEQIIGILKQHEAGVKTADVCREHGISAATFYGWKSKYGGLDVIEAHVIASKANDYATTSLIEIWIDDAERSAWFLFEATR